MPYQEIFRWIGMLPGKALYGDNVLPLVYWAQGSLGINIAVAFLLASEELCLSDLSGRIRRGGPHIRGCGSEIGQMVIQT